jgi:hypothetical protein
MTQLRPSLWIDAFEAEAEWANPRALRVHPGFQTVTQAQRPLAGVLNLLCGPGDCFTLASPPGEAAIAHWRRAGLRGRPVTSANDLPPGAPARAVAQLFAVTPSSILRAREFGTGLDHPAMETVRRVNGKLWSFEARARLGCGLGRLIRSGNALEHAAQTIGSREGLVVKEDHGVSGRGNFVVTSPGGLARLKQYLDRQVKAGAEGALVAEPYLAVAVDFSGHLEITREGDTRFLGMRRTINDAGRYVASCALPARIEAQIRRSGYAQVMQALGAALFSEGYFGPASVDSVLTADGQVVPVLEVNARLSMGRLALAAEQQPGAARHRCALLKLATDPAADASSRVLCAVERCPPGEATLLNPAGATTDEKGHTVLWLRFDGATGAKQVLDRLAAAYAAEGIGADFHRLDPALLDA